MPVPAQPMEKVLIGILREGKIPVDRRSPLSPTQAQQVSLQYENVQVKCQHSLIRCFSDEEYLEVGIPVEEELEDCDILFGVKEVPIKELIPNKTYFFFSHTIKQQPHNRKLLQAILQKKIRLVDYECLTDLQGNRLIAFGRYAGIVGAYNGILAYGLKYHLFDLRRARDCFDLADLKTEFSKVKLPRIKIIVTGGGRAANGAIEVLEGMRIQRVTPKEILEKEFDQPVYAQLRSADYHKRKRDGGFDAKEFYATPHIYESTFLTYAQKADLLIAAAFWKPTAPALFTREDMQHKDFKVRVIADITCDIGGSIPSTKRPSTIDDPVYDYNPWEDKVALPFSDRKFVSVMAVDNLPCELPRDASKDFGKEIVQKILPGLLGKDKDAIIARATIAEHGRLTPPFQYLKQYVEGT